MDVLPSVLRFVIVWVMIVPAVTVPLFTFLHELGHAIMALLLTSCVVTVQLGVRGVQFRGQWGRLTVIVYLGLEVFFGFYRLGRREELSTMRALCIILGGPITSLLFTALFGMLARSSGWAPGWLSLAIINLVGFLNTSLPWEYPSWMGIIGGMPSDLLRGWRLIRQAKARAAVDFFRAVQVDMELLLRKEKERWRKRQ